MMNCSSLSLVGRRIVLCQQARSISTAPAWWGSDLRTNSRVPAYALAAALLAGAVGVMGAGKAEAKAKTPPSSQLYYKFVIVGAGVAARSCLGTLTTLNPDRLPEGSEYTGKVLMIGNQPRMNSLGLSDEELACLQQVSDDPQNKIRLGHEATKLDVAAKTIELDNGTVVKFDRCFLATGSSFERLKNVTPEAESSVTTFKRHQDCQVVLDGHKTGQIKHVTVVGGGPLGCEIALALQTQAPDLQVTQLYAEPGVMNQSLPEYLRAYFTAILRNKGIEQRNFSLLTNINYQEDTGRLCLTVDSWEQYYTLTDYVMFAPTRGDAVVDLMEEAGLEIDSNNGGVVVNGELMAFTDIYVGGDAASYPNKYLGRRRDQTYDHAVSSGKHAANNMCGQRATYSHIPVTTVKLDGVGLTASLVGNCESRLETVSFWEKGRPKGLTDEQLFYTTKFHKGVTFYMQNGYIVGVLLTNSDGVEKARQAIADSVDYSPLTRQELEMELREEFGAGLHLPLMKTTMPKGRDDALVHVSKNIYKGKRHVTEGLQSHKVDILRDDAKILYWGKV